MITGFLRAFIVLTIPLASPKEKYRGLVDCVPTCEPKGRWFSSLSGRVPGSQARSPFEGVREAATHWCFSPSLSPSLQKKRKKEKYLVKGPT